MPLISQEKFNQEYQKLNTEQRQAVDTVEGPVMVIAGAGTGKTQTIALRIANILLKTQTPPQSILCLTFTETGTTAMRQRLLSIIGPSAYGVKIHTFHSFCNEVIKTNPEYFIFAKNIESLEELEKIEIIQSLIEKLPDGSILKPWGDHFYFQRDIISSIQTLKRENITPETFLNLIESQKIFLENSKTCYQDLKSLRASKKLESETLPIVTSLLKIAADYKAISGILNYKLDLYKRDYYIVGSAKNPIVNFKNDLLKFWENLEKDIPKQLELHQIYINYQEELKKRGRYDFDDMILFVLNQFKTNKDLLLNYQEKFQYILVDEYQDTNSAQNEIISLLGSYFDTPNIFVVGDDDQSIFRFQGAAIENIFDFYSTYQKQVKVVVLKNNYRSHQLILDTSKSVIDHNQNRITHYIKDIDKSLVSAKNFDPDPINLYSANSNLEENYFIAQKIKELIKNGTDPKEIAVLFRNNSDVSDLVPFFDNLDIKYRLGVGDNILEDIKILQLIKLLAYIENPSDDETLFHILSFEFCHINSFDLLKILRFSRQHHIPLSQLIENKEKLKEVRLRPNTITRLVNFSLRVAKAQKWLSNYSLDRFYNKFIRKFDFLSYLLAQNDIFLINHLNIFYGELKRLSLTQNFTLGQFLNRINLFIQNKIPLSAPEINLDDEAAVNLMTVHKSKGLEFEHVFLIKCLDRKWGNSSGGNYLRLPAGILKTELSILATDENEEERRLFYVALTRAKNQIYISYSCKNDSGRDQIPSMFISEIEPKLLEPVKPIPQSGKLALLTLYQEEPKPLITDNYLINYLKRYLSSDYVFNITHLNSYLKCPLCFYYKTILRIPAVKNKYAALGTAVHNSLSYLFDTLKQNKKLIHQAEFIEVFHQYLLRENLKPLEFSESLLRGTESLVAYYQNYKNEFNCNCITEYDFNYDHVHLDNIPITGKIDKIEILDSKTDDKFNINVVDFKTGNPDGKYKELKEEGDYFRQLVFYKILAENDPAFKYHVHLGTIDFVQKSKQKNNFVKKTFEINGEETENLKKLIKEVYQKIINLDFNHLGDNCRDEQELHNLIS